MTDDLWVPVARWGPLGLLLIAVVLVVLSRDAIGVDGSNLALVCAGVLAALHLAWVVLRRGPLGGTGGLVYWAIRAVLGFVASIGNPLMAVFTTVGYFDSHLYVPRRLYVASMLPVAVTAAGAQSGGLWPESSGQAMLLAGLLVVNVGISMPLAAVSLRDEDRSAAQTATIDELNAALADNERLHAELLEQARTAGVHEERERLALEIHDTLAQSLIGIVTQLQAADDAVDPAAAVEHRGRAATLAREALGEARRSVQGLGPSVLASADLDDAVRDVVEGWSASSGVATQLVVTGEASQVAHDVAAVVVRVTQEALSNVAKHASASRVGVTVSFTDDEVVLDVRDDGVGFGRPVDISGFGLDGMHRRAATVRGDLVVESEPGSGTAVSLRVPVVAHG